MRKTKILLIFIFVINICAVFFPFYNNDNTVHAALSSSTYGKIHFINVTLSKANSDAILLESNGKLCLIDTGNPASYGTGSGKITYTDADGKKVADYIKSIGGTHLDYIIVTHSHSDHIGGVKQIVDSGLVDSNTKYYYRKQYTDDPNNKNKTDDQFNNDKYGMNNEYYYNIAVKAIRSKTSNLIDVTDNTNINITVGNFKIKLLNTESWNNKGNTGINPRENNNAIYSYVTIGNKKVLLTSDMETIDEQRLINNGSIGKIDLLKMGDHGLANASSISFLDTVKPNGVVVSGTINYDIHEQNLPGMRHILNKGYVSEIYFTSKVKKAIIAEFTSTSYTLKNADNSTPISNSKITLDVVKSGEWTRIMREKSEYGWYVLDSNDNPKKGWYKSGDYWYLLNTKSGIMMTGWRGNYYLNPTVGGSIPEGAMVTGWLKDGGKWYYLNPSETDSVFKEGECVRGFRKIGGKWYYFYTAKDDGITCAMNTNTTHTIGDQTFKFNSNSECTNFSGFANKPTADNYCKATTYNGSSQTITKTAGTGYTFSNNSKTNAGSYKVTASLKNGYLWSNTTSDDVTFTCAISQVNISGASISSISDVQYTGSAIKPTPTVKISLNGTTKTLIKDTDYTISYSNNIKVGKATLKITGKGNYSGSKSVLFNIVDNGLSFIDTTNMKIRDNKVYITLKNGLSINKNTLFNNISNSNGKRLYDSKNNEIISSSELVGTGYKIIAAGKEYPIVVYGDIDGTGDINVNDLAIVYKYIVEPNSIHLTGLNKEAGDTDNNGVVDTNDLRNIYMIIVK